MRVKDVLRVAIVVACIPWAYGSIRSIVGAQAPTPWLKSMPEQGYTPGTIVIEKDAPAKNLVCAVPDRGGTYACITVGELRVLLFNRKLK